MWQMRADGLTADSGPSSSRTSGVRDGVFIHSPWRLRCSWTSLLCSSCCAETLRVCLPDAEVATRSPRGHGNSAHRRFTDWKFSPAGFVALRTLHVLVMAGAPSCGNHVCQPIWLKLIYRISV